MATGTADDGAVLEGSGVIENVLIGAVKLASLPLLLLAIVVAAGFYAAASLARPAFLAWARARRWRTPGRGLGRAPRPQDA